MLFFIIDIYREKDNHIETDLHTRIFLMLIYKFVVITANVFVQ